MIGAAQHRHIGVEDVRAIAKSGARAPILKEIVAEQKAAAEAELELAEQRRAEAEAWQEAQDEESLTELDALSAELEPFEDPEIKAILDGGRDPALPPIPEPIPVTPETTFEKAIAMLMSIATKPLSTFAGTSRLARRHRRAAAFLHDVAARRKAPAPLADIVAAAEEEHAEEITPEIEIAEHSGDGAANDPLLDEIHAVLKRNESHHEDSPDHIRLCELFWKAQQNIIADAGPKPRRSEQAKEVAGADRIGMAPLSRQVQQATGLRRRPL